MHHFYYKEELQKIKQELFPFDTYRVYKEENNKLLVSKLNSENKNKFWIYNENVKTSKSNINEQIRRRFFTVQYPTAVALRWRRRWSTPMEDGSLGGRSELGRGREGGRRGQQRDAGKNNTIIL